MPRAACFRFSARRAYFLCWGRHQQETFFAGHREVFRGILRKLGHGVADELVDWFNTVDATYRSDLRDLFQGQFAALRHEIEQRFAAFDAKLERRVGELRSGLREEMAGLETRLSHRIDGLRVDMHGMETRLIRWMVAMWAGTIGTMIALLRLWR
ncbi:MAG: hypothetical protein IH876_12525 [Gemmatimonadetes bacterium]|nr:hypothetical protein [Gemmatimonadota bacterium]